MKTTKYLGTLLFVIAASVIFFSCKKSSSSPSKSSVTVTTFAGTGASGANNDTGTAASFSFPSSLAIYEGSVMYVGDFGNNMIRSINLSTTTVALFAGTGTAGLLNGASLFSEFSGPANVVFDPGGKFLYVADEENNVIRGINPAGNVVTIAGSGTAGYQDGPASTAEFNFPEGMAVDASGNIYVADGHNNVIRKINMSTSTVSTYAGTGAAGFDNGAVATATFNQPYGMAIDASGNLYVTDIQNNCIRKITVSTGTVTTYAGSGAQGATNGAAAAATFYYPLGCAIDLDGNLYVSDTYNNLIRKVSTSGTVTTFAGTGAQGSADGAAASATFNFPIGLAVNGNDIYVADTHNNNIRKITIVQ
jgi:sugar lactone lactonase YvrE